MGLWRWGWDRLLCRTGGRNYISDVSKALKSEGEVVGGAIAASNRLSEVDVGLVGIPWKNCPVLLWTEENLQYRCPGEFCPLQLVIAQEQHSQGGVHLHPALGSCGYNRGHTGCRCTLGYLALLCLYSLLFARGTFKKETLRKKLHWLSMFKSKKKKLQRTKYFVRKVLGLPSNNEFTQANLCRYCLTDALRCLPPILMLPVKMFFFFLKKLSKCIHLHILFWFCFAEKMVVAACLLSNSL